MDRLDYGLSMKEAALAIALVFLFEAAMVWLAAYQRGGLENVELSILAVSAGVSLLLVCFVAYFRSFRTTLSAEGIRVVRPFGKERVFRWEEVESVSLKNDLPLGRGRRNWWARIEHEGGTVELSELELGLSGEEMPKFVEAVQEKKAKFG